MATQTQTQGDQEPAVDDLDQLESAQLASTRGDPSVAPIQPDPNYLDSDTSVDEEGYEISRPTQERPLAQQDPPVGRPLPSDR